MSYRVRYTREARDDLLRLYRFLLDEDVDAARRAYEAIVKATTVLQDFPFTCRKADPANPFLRGLMPFGPPLRLPPRLFPRKAGIWCIY